MPKISFVVPLYNKEAYIGNTIQSLLNQTLKDIEIIVVDDKSKDASLEIVSGCKDKRVRVIALKKNVGRSEARNIGNKEARSKIICVNDADDISHKTRADAIYKYFQRHKVDMVYSGFAVCNDNDVMGEQVGVQDFDLDVVRDTGYTFVCHSTMAYTKKLANAIKYTSGKFSDLGIDDWKFQMDILKKKYKVGSIKDPLVVYRLSGGGISRNRNENEVKKLKIKTFKEIFNEDLVLAN
jgi:teichuronic acid biosynthesis glycosyltransferase TuaG